jgi:WD40 repeat protein
VRRRWPAVAALVLAGLLLGGWALWSMFPRPAPVVDDGGPAPTVARPAEDDQAGWVPLFNGKDLTGWRRHAAQPAGWEAQDGEIIVTGPTSHLYTVRDDFTDFRLRLEVLLEPGDDNTLFVRSGFGPSPAGRGWFPDGYPIHLQAEPVKAGQWRRVEVIARGSRIQTRIDGRTIEDFENRLSRLPQGRIALQHVGRGTKVRFRRIEARESPQALPGAPPSDPQPRHVLFQALPDTPILAKAGIRYDKDGWRIDAGANPAALQLFAVDQPGFETGRLRCRFQVRGEAAGFTTVGLELRYPQGEIQPAPLRLQVSTSWVAHEVSFANQVPGQKPEQVRITVVPSAKSPIWLKDVEVDSSAFRHDEQQVEAMRPRPIEQQVEPLGTLTGHLGPVSVLDFAPDGRTLVTGGLDGQVIFWSAGAQGWKQRRAVRAGRGAVTALAVAPDGNTVAAGSHDSKVRLYLRKGDDWQEGAVLGGLGGPVACLAWAPDSARLAAGESFTTPAGSARVHLWDARTGKKLFDLGEGKIQGVAATIFSPDGKRLGIGWRRAAERNIEWWDVDKRQRVETWRGFVAAAWAAHFLSDGQMLAAHSSGPAFAIWRQLEDGQTGPGQWLVGHTAPIRDLALSSDGAVAASASDDRTVQLRDVASGLELATLRGHQAAVTQLAFARAGGMLASAGEDATVKLWRLAPQPPGGPFVVLARQGRKDRAFPSLAAAVAAALGEDTIEVRGNGPFLSNRIVIKDKALTIRAGAGFWPLIALDPHAAVPSTLIHTNARLTLEGLELHRAPVKETANLRTIVFSMGAELRLAHCRLVARGDAAAAHCSEPKRCEMKSCLLLAENGPAVAWERPNRAHMVIDGCVVTGDGLVVGDTTPARPVRDVSLRVTHSTLIGRAALDLRIYEPADKKPAGAPKPGLQVKVEDSVLGPSNSLVVLRAMKASKLGADDAAAWLPYYLDWKDHRCLLGLGKTSVGLMAPNRPAVAMPQAETLADWDRIWRQKDTLSRAGTPTIPTQKLYSLLPENVRWPDVTAGADASRLGPGAAYWQWRRSPQYDGWHKQPNP